MRASGLKYICIVQQVPTYIPKIRLKLGIVAWSWFIFEAIYINQRTIPNPVLSFFSKLVQKMILT